MDQSSAHAACSHVICSGDNAPETIRDSALVATVPSGPYTPPFRPRKRESVGAIAELGLYDGMRLEEALRCAIAFDRLSALSEAEGWR